jgi:nucleoside-diphosphate-sugar epimerase
MNTILLTGATGFLGSHLLDALVDRNYNVVILKRTTSNTWRIEQCLDKVKSYDIDKISIKDIFEENSIQTIIHLATFYKKKDDERDVAEMINVNITFPASLLQYAIRYNVKTFINTGTFFEYDCSVLPVTEESKIKAFNFYAKTKIGFESILSTYRDKLKIITLRLFSPYGEKDNEKLLPMLTKKALNNEPIQLSDGLQKLDFIHSSDIVNAYLKVLQNSAEQTGDYDVYNIGFGFPISVRDIVSILEQKLQKDIDVTWGVSSQSDIKIAWADNSKARNKLEWKPQVDIHSGLDKLIKYYQDGV